MVEFETLKRDTVRFGDNEFIEVARKKAISEDGENEFISLARGYVDEEGDERYKANFSVPVDDEVVAFLQDILPDMLDFE